MSWVKIDVRCISIKIGNKESLFVVIVVRLSVFLLTIQHSSFRKKVSASHRLEMTLGLVVSTRMQKGKNAATTN